MDVYDAGVFTYKFVATVPKSLKVVLWGPLQAKELGFEDWSYQDGGETGFIYHTPARAIKMGTAAATLTVVRRLGRAYFTIYLAGYPTDAAREQRLIDVRGLVTEAELFLTRLSKETVKFELADEKALIDHSTTPREAPSSEAAPTPRVVGRRAATKPVTWEV